MTKYRIFAIMLAFALLLTGCKGVAPDRTEPPETTEGKPKPNVLYGWEGDFSEENLRKTIETYQQNCTPFVSDGTNGTSVSFETNLAGYSVSVPRLSKVDDRDIAIEMRGYIDQSVETMRIGGRITVVTDWWHKSTYWGTKKIPVWSYLVRVGGAAGTEHYYYFRVNYGAA